MKTIYKYQLNIVDIQQIEIPSGSIILSVGKDPQGKVCAWAKVDTSASIEIRTLFIVGTGNPAPDDKSVFIGTVTDGPFVWHIFESTVVDL